MLSYISSFSNAVVENQHVKELSNSQEDLDLDYETVSRLASLPLHCHSVEYPNKLNQVLQNETELLPPSGKLYVSLNI